MTLAWIRADCKNDKTSNVQIELIDNSPFHLKGSFQGPEGTAYEGGHFDVVSPLFFWGQRLLCCHCCSVIATR